MTAPLHLYGPYYSRRARVTQRVLRALRTLAIVASVVVGVPMAAGVAYAMYLLATGY